MRELLAFLGSMGSEFSGRIYPIYVYQSYIHATTCLIMLLSIPIFIYLYVHIINRLSIQNIEEENVKAVTLVAIAFGVFVFWAVFVHSQEDILTGYINPNYLAIKDILGVLK